MKLINDINTLTTAINDELEDLNEDGYELEMLQDAYGVDEFQCISERITDEYQAMERVLWFMRDTNLNGWHDRCTYVCTTPFTI